MQQRQIDFAPEVEIDLGIWVEKGTLDTALVGDADFAVIFQVQWPKPTGGIRNKTRIRCKAITFDRSGKIRGYDDVSFGKWRETATIDVAVFAGDRNTPQKEVAYDGRRRIPKSVGDII